MVEVSELEKLKEEINNLRKQKIIQMAKLKQKEDRITELSKKLRAMAVKSSESISETDSTRMKELEDELNLSRKNNKSLRAENVSLKRQLEEAKKAKSGASSAAPSSGPIQAVSTSRDSGQD